MLGKLRRAALQLAVVDVEHVHQLEQLQKEYEQQGFARYAPGAAAHQEQLKQKRTSFSPMPTTAQKIEKEKIL